MSATDSLLPRLVLWTGLGLSGAIGVIVCGAREDWIGFAPCLLWANVSIFMLGTGLWTRWPRG